MYRLACNGIYALNYQDELKFGPLNYVTYQIPV